MNSIYTYAVKKEIKSGLIILAITVCLLIAILALQSIKFASRLWVLLEFGYHEWGEYLLDMLASLRIWAIVTGVIFSVRFLAYSPAYDPKKIPSRIAVGFIAGFAFTYFLVLMIGIVIYIPLGMVSVFVPSLIRFATLHFAWLMSAYIIFILIAMETPPMLLYAIKKGNWRFKLMGTLMALLLGVQIWRVAVGGFLLIMENSIWRTNTALVTLGVSLLITIIINIILLRGEAIAKLIFAIMAVYIASTVTGNVTYGILHWGELSSLILASFIGPITYSLVAKTLINFRARIKSIISFCTGAGLFLGIIVGMVCGGFIAR